MYSGSSRLDDVEFLTRSTNRLDVLDKIGHAPRSRRDLRDDTDFSRVTLSRILGDLADRGWIVRRNGTYEATAEGTIVGAEVTRLFDNLAAVDTLGRTLRWLPTEKFDFELGRLADAEVMLPGSPDLTEQIRWVGRRLRDAPSVCSVATWLSSDVLEVLVESTVHGDCTFDGVVAGHVVEFVRDHPEFREPVQALLATDGATLHRYDGCEATVTMSIYPDGVLMCGRRDETSFPEAIGSSDEAVVAWAAAHFEDLRADSVPLDADSFTP